MSVIARAASLSIFPSPKSFCFFKTNVPDVCVLVFRASMSLRLLSLRTAHVQARSLDTTDAHLRLTYVLAIFHDSFEDVLNANFHEDNQDLFFSPDSRQLDHLTFKYDITLPHSVYLPPSFKITDSAVCPQLEHIECPPPTADQVCCCLCVLTDCIILCLCVCMCLCVLSVL